MMLDPHWAIVAERIHAWLETTAAQRESPRTTRQTFDAVEERGA